MEDVKQAVQDPLNFVRFKPIGHISKSLELQSLKPGDYYYVPVF